VPLRRDDLSPWAWSRAVRTLRASLGLTRLAFAGVVGVSEYTTAAWECGHSLPRRRMEQRVRELAARNGLPFVLEPEPFDLDVPGLDRPEPAPEAASW